MSTPTTDTDQAKPDSTEAPSPAGDGLGESTVRLSGKKLLEYRKQLLREMETATGAMQDHAERLGDPKYPTAEADLKASALRYQRAVIAHMRTIAKSSVDVCLPNKPECGCLTLQFTLFPQ